MLFKLCTIQMAERAMMLLESVTPAKQNLEIKFGVKSAHNQSSQKCTIPFTIISSLVRPWFLPWCDLVQNSSYHFCLCHLQMIVLLRRKIVAILVSKSCNFYVHFTVHFTVIYGIPS